MDTAAPRTRVKVCGITCVEDARAAVEAGADLLGFVLAESPRRVSPERAAEILAAAPGAEGVAVMVRPRPEEAVALAQRAAVGRIQVHGVDPAAWPPDFPLPVIFAVGVADASPEAGAWPDHRHWMLCDTLRAGHWGGSGQSFPWALVAGLARTRPLVISGGLAADNVGRALADARPMGVDASSRLESAPGIKDPERVRAFVAAVRLHDAAAARG